MHALLVLLGMAVLVGRAQVFPALLVEQVWSLRELLLLRGVAPLVVGCSCLAAVALPLTACLGQGEGRAPFLDGWGYNPPQVQGIQGAKGARRTKWFPWGGILLGSAGDDKKSTNFAVGSHLG